MKNQMTDKITDQIIENKVNLEDQFPYVTDKKPLEKAEIIYRTTWKHYPIYIKSVMGLYPTAYIDVKNNYIIENYDCASFRLKHKKFERMLRLRLLMPISIFVSRTRAATKVRH